MKRIRLYPPSVDPGFPVLPSTPQGWQRLKFADVLQVVARPKQLEPDKKYRLVNARRNRGGITLRAEVLGCEVLTKTQFEAKAGDFLISRRQIVHGACGVVPAAMDGAVVSNEYSTLRTRSALLMDFLKHYSHSPYFQRSCFHSSHGVAVEKMVFKLEEWLARDVDIPPLPEQRRIVAILSAVDEAIEKTEAVIESLQTLKEALIQELFTRGLPGRHTSFKQTEIGEIPTAWEAVDLGAVLDGIDAGWSPQCLPDPPPEGSWGVLKVSAVTSGAFFAKESKALPANLVPRPEIEVRAGDVILARANGALDLVGRTVFVRQTPPKLMLSDKLLRLRSNPKHLDARFLHCAFQSRSVRAQLLQTTGGSHMRNVSQSALRATVLPLPSLGEQTAIADVLLDCDDRVEAESGTLRELAELKTALSSILLTGELRVRPDEGVA